MLSYVHIAVTREGRSCGISYTLQAWRNSHHLWLSWILDDIRSFFSLMLRYSAFRHFYNLDRILDVTMSIYFKSPQIWPACGLTAILRRIPAVKSDVYTSLMTEFEFNWLIQNIFRNSVSCATERNTASVTFANLRI